MLHSLLVWKYFAIILALKHWHLFFISFIEKIIQCDAVITRSILKYSQKTPHSSPVRARYGASFVDSVSDWYSASVPAIMYAICCYIWPRYNGTRLYTSGQKTSTVFNSKSPLISNVDVCFRLNEPYAASSLVITTCWWFPWGAKPCWKYPTHINENNTLPLILVKWMFH